MKDSVICQQDCKHIDSWKDLVHNKNGLLFDKSKIISELTKENKKLLQEKEFIYAKLNQVNSLLEEIRRH